ncbi:uncharacterized protein [Palaemon carinicauda]|uniref:uncharacterized protein n=1 Tax=Palaemon carinicauda TaxID=392227 RepID=UPI0035B5C62C
MPFDIEHPERFSITAEANSVATRWQQCCEAFKIYLEALGNMKDAQKKALLLRTAGREVREVFKTLQPTDDTSEAAIKALTTYFAPQQVYLQWQLHRLQRWAITLAVYHYDIEYRPTSNMGNADALSRLPEDKAPEEYVDSVLLISVYDVAITAKDVAHSTKRDPNNAAEHNRRDTLKFVDGEED